MSAETADKVSRDAYEAWWRRSELLNVLDDLKYIQGQLDEVRETIAGRVGYVQARIFADVAQYAVKRMICALWYVCEQDPSYKGDPLSTSN